VSDRPIDLIGEGVDCAIRGGGLAETSLIARRLCQLDYVTCAAPAYAERYGLPQKPSDIATGHVVLGYFSSLTSKPFPLLFHRGGEAMEIGASSIVSTNESTAHITALVAGLGIGQTFRFIAQPYLDDGRLLPALQDWSRPPHPLHLLYPPNRHLNARVRVFVDWVAGVFAKADVGAGSPAALQPEP
jgi:DNA-binding transcriptional LysR family regulator